MRARVPWRSALPWVVLVVTAVSCTTRPESEEVADRFMDLYYAQASPARAVTLCTGAARTRLEGELNAIKGVPPDAPADRPRVTYRLTSTIAETSTQAKYTYRVEADTADIGPVIASVVLVNEGGRWLITSLDETEGPR